MAVKRACGSAASTPVRGTETRWLLCDDRRERTQPATGGLFVGSRCRAQCRCHSISRRSLLPIVESTGGNVEEVGDGGGKKQNGGDRCDLV